MSPTHSLRGARRLALTVAALASSIAGVPTPLASAQVRPTAAPAADARAAARAARQASSTRPWLERGRGDHGLAAVTGPDGRPYYRGFRVTSREGLARLTGSSSFRFMGGDGQYGEGLYLFTTAADAARFAEAERSRGAVQRSLIVEVLLPKAHVDAVSVRRVSPSLDWGLLYRSGHPRRERLRDVRNASHVLYGRWAPTRAGRGEAGEDRVYAPLLGARQVMVRDVGLDSVLQRAIFRIWDPGAAAE